MFREFSIVVSGSVIISSFAALTFTPMLATKLLVKKEKKNKFYLMTEPFFEGLNKWYRHSLDALLKVKWVAIPFTVVMLGLIERERSVPEKRGNEHTPKLGRGCAYCYIQTNCS